ncbi:Ig-like domain-containing protein [Methylorubrum podarium]|uniref:Ig-like domain-containing protein n=1 Tax=Methylorubrum podarium TaxID=200476 RepID=A0ABV1QSB1_9HYPH
MARDGITGSLVDYTSYNVAELFGSSEYVSLISGYQWGKRGEGIRISYSFPGANGSNTWRASDHYSDTREWSDWGYLNSTQISNVRLAFAEWDEISNIDFYEVVESTQQTGDIRIAFSGMLGSGTWGHAYYPSSLPAGGDIWIHERYAADSFSVGSYGFMALLHEIGHAIGLKHPHEATARNSQVMPDGYDSIDYTVMSYDHASHSGASGWPSTLGRFDNQAVDALYGSDSNRPPADASTPLLTLSASDTQLTAGEVATVTFQFSEAVRGFAANDVAATGGTLSNFFSVDADTFTALYTPNANFNGSGNVSVAASSYSDLAGNSGGAGQISLSVNTTSGRPGTVVQPEEVYRFFNAKTNGHFFTVSEAERDQVRANLPDFRYEGVGYYAFETDQGAATEEVYRFFNAKTNGHFFTISEAERDQVRANLPDFRYEGVGSFAFETDQGAATEAVYRFFNAKTNGHFFTISEAERDQVRANLPDFRYEGIAFYAPDDGATFVI